MVVESLTRKTPLSLMPCRTLFVCSRVSAPKYQLKDTSLLQQYIPNQNSCTAGKAKNPSIKEGCKNIANQQYQYVYLCHYHTNRKCSLCLSTECDFLSLLSTYASLSSGSKSSTNPEAILLRIVVSPHSSLMQAHSIITV